MAHDARKIMIHSMVSLGFSCNIIVLFSGLYFFGSIARTGQPFVLHDSYSAMSNKLASYNTTN